MTSAGETAPASTAGQVMTQAGAEKEPSSQASAQKQPSGSPAASPHRHAIALPSASIVRPESFGAVGRFSSPRRGRLWASPTALRQASPSTQWDNRAPGTPHLSPHRRRAAGRERGCCTSTPIGPGARRRSTSPNGSLTRSCRNRRSGYGRHPGAAVGDSCNKGAAWPGAEPPAAPTPRGRGGLNGHAKPGRHEAPPGPPIS